MGVFQASMLEAMEMYFCGPSLPPRFGQGAQSEHGSDPNGSDHTSKHSKQPEWVCSVKAKKHLDRSKHKVRATYISQSSYSEESTVLCTSKKKSAQPKRAPSE